MIRQNSIKAAQSGDVLIGEEWQMKSGKQSFLDDMTWSA